MSSERDIVTARWELARLDPLYFGRWFCFTLNPHADASKGEDPIQPFPADRPHIIGITRLWQANSMLMITKSRQMLVTWWASFLLSWCLLFRKGQALWAQSKKLEDAVGDENKGDGLLGRSKFIINHIPYRDWFIRPRSLSIQSEVISYAANNSGITAIAQGGDQIRSHTVSGLVSDETAFQPEFESAYLASMASIRRGWWVGITTPDLSDGGASMRIAKDMPDPQ